jgi:hypothetical protein
MKESIAMAYFSMCNIKGTLERDLWHQSILILV